MFVLRRNVERRHVRRGKLEVLHTFFPGAPPGSIADGFGDLVGFDEIWLPPGKRTTSRTGGEVEVVTYVYKGALGQEDSSGISRVLHAGEFQCMSTSRDLRHMEVSESRSGNAHLFRGFLCPSVAEFEYTSEQRRFTAAQRRNKLCIIASPDCRKGSLRNQQDALVFSCILDPGIHLVHELLPGRQAWLHVIEGEAKLHDFVLAQGDGVGVASEPSVSLTVRDLTEILMFDLAIRDVAVSGHSGRSETAR